MVEIQTKNLTKIGTRKLMMPIPINLIKMYGKGLYLSSALLYENEDRIFGRYSPIILGISWNDVVIFEENKEKNLIMKIIIPLSTINHIKITPIQSKSNKITNESEPPYQLIIFLKNKKKIWIQISPHLIMNNRKLDESRIIEKE